MVDEKRVAEIRAKAHGYENFSGCSQAVVLALQEGLSIGNADSYRAATAFAGGVARRGETCGALIGALMAVGLEEGRSRKEDLDKLNGTVGDAHAVADEFQRRIAEEFNLKKPLSSTLCRDIHAALFGRTWNLYDPAGRTAFIAAGGHGDDGCLKVCGIAAECAARAVLARRGASSG